jgi:hypothetical protein
MVTGNRVFLLATGGWQLAPGTILIAVSKRVLELDVISSY